MLCRRIVCFVLLLLATVVLRTPSAAHADEPSPYGPKGKGLKSDVGKKGGKNGKDGAPGGVQAEIDVHAVYRAISEELSSLSPQPLSYSFPSLPEAYRLATGRRMSRVRIRIKKLNTGLAWEMAEKGGVATGLKQKSWSGTPRNMFSLYTELGMVLGHYRKAKLDYNLVFSEEMSRYPPREPPGPMPSEAALDEIRASISSLVIAGLRVPWTLRNAETRLESQVAREWAAARKASYAAYEKNRHKARSDATARFSVYQLEFEALKDGLLARMQDLKDLLAAAQVVEEERLRAEIEPLASDTKFTKLATKLLKRMAKGRKDAVKHRDSRWSRYGNDVRKYWLIPRSTLLTKLKTAKRNKAKAESEAAQPAGGG